MRTATVYINDLNGAQVFHAFQIDHGPEWHCSGVHYTGVIIAMSEADLAKLISRQVHKMEMWSFHSQWYIDQEGRTRSQVNDCYPDEMGGVVIDGEYLGYAEWLRRAIPKTTVLQLDTSAN